MWSRSVSRSTQLIFRILDRIRNQSNQYYYRRILCSLVKKQCSYCLCKISFKWAEYRCLMLPEQHTLKLPRDGQYSQSQTQSMEPIVDYGNAGDSVRIRDKEKLCTLSSCQSQFYRLLIYWRLIEGKKCQYVVGRRIFIHSQRHSPIRHAPVNQPNTN